jgi:hypothetical protein
MAIVGSKATRKMLGDAGEHYALSRFTFAGKPAMKMPDGWRAYDLGVETGTGLARVSVKTRSESVGWKTSKWFSFDDRRECEWLVCIFQPKEGPIRAWIIPMTVALQHANKPGEKRKQPHIRDISWPKLTRAPLSQFEDNWAMSLEVALEAHSRDMRNARP